MDSPTITVLGSIHMDFTVMADRIPAPGETVVGNKFKMSPGGKGANQAVATSRLGANTYMVGRVGGDYLGGLLLKNLKENDVNTDFVVEDSSTYTGLALITVDKQGQNIISVVPGTDAALTERDVDLALPTIVRSAAFLLQLETPMEVVEYAAEKASASGTKVFLNPAPFKALPRKLFKNIFALTPNEVEASALTGISMGSVDAIEEAGLRLLALGVENVVITLGARGAFFVSPKERLYIPAHRVKVLDATGAGDAFNAALAVSIAEGSTLADAVKFANLVAACKVTKLGAQDGLPTRSEVKEFQERLPTL